MGERNQRHYPQIACNIVEDMFRVENPDPKPGLRRIVQREVKRSGLRVRDLMRDARDGMRSFG
jgi:electron transfer flavoprotein-quinone oxidoreductase